jgi:hypothetical protein
MSEGDFYPIAESEERLYENRRRRAYGRWPEVKS